MNLDPFPYPSVLFTQFRWVRRLIGGRWGKCSFGWVRVREECLDRCDEHWANCIQLVECADDLIAKKGNNIDGDTALIDRLRRSILYLNNKNVRISD